MLKFNHKIEVIYKKVFFINCVLQLLIFYFLFLFYSLNLDNVKGQIKSEVNKSMTKFRDIFLTYYQQKFLILIDDLVILKNTFEKYTSDQNKEKLELYLNDTFLTSEHEKCLINLSAIKNQTIYKQAWYSQSNFEPENLSDYEKKVMIGSWFQKENKNNISDMTYTQKKNLAILCKMNKMLKKIFEKNLQWSFKYPIQIEFAHFSFNDSLFYKYPAIYSETYTNQNKKLENDCTNFNITTNFYDPLCREFYKETTKASAEITITLPYIQASSKKYGTEICIRSKKNLDPNDKSVSFIICFNINYFDVDSFRSQLQGHLSNKKLYIVYIDRQIESIIKQSQNINYSKNNEITTINYSDSNLALNVSDCKNVNGYKDIRIKTIYSSEIPSENFLSFSNYLNIEYSSDNNFYDILSYNMILGYFKNQTKYEQRNLLYSDPKKFFEINKEKSIAEDYNTTFREFIKNYNLTIKCPMINKTLEMYSKDKFQALPSDSYSISVERSIDFIDPQEKINGMPVNIDFFIFPAFSNFDLINDKIEILDQTKFFIVIAGKFSNDELFKKFQLGLLYKFAVYFFFLVLFNILLWFVLTGLIFYVFRIYFYPLKKIQTNYQNLFYPEVIIFFAFIFKILF